MSIRTKKPGSSGFTLIELLVVIAIIGILSSVVLAGLTSARKKGNDAAIKSSLNNARAQAELFYDSNGGAYTGTNDICASGATAGSVKGVYQFAKAALDASPGATLNLVFATAGSASTVTCHANATTWALEAPLKGTTGITNPMYCVDNTGYSTTTSDYRLSGSDASCL